MQFVNQGAAELYETRDCKLIIALTPEAEALYAHP